MSSSNSEFNLECSGVIKIANLQKVLSALDEEDKIEVNFGGPTMEPSPLQIEKFIEGVGGKRRIQAKEERDSEKWYYKSPNGEVRNISGFPNPNVLKCLEYTIHAGIKRRGYLKIGVVGFREDIEIKKESSLFAGRININIKKQLPGEGLNKKALKEAAVEIFEIYELVDK